MTAAQSAANSAVGSPLSGAWLTIAEQNATVGYPDALSYPGPTATGHPDATSEPLVRNQPLRGQAEPEGYPSQAYQDNLAGGIIPDTAAEDLGHSAPVASFSSNEGAPFAPPGAIADTHGQDTGGTYRTEHVPMPSSPGWWRRVLTGQTFNRQAQVTDNAGWDINAPNDRVNLNQDTGQAANGYDPMWLPYSERPVTANFAAEAYPIQDAPGGYAPQGGLSDMGAMGGQGNLVYEAPPDPAVNVQPPAQAPASVVALGMEYVQG